MIGKRRLAQEPVDWATFPFTASEAETVKARLREIDRTNVSAAHLIDTAWNRILAAAIKYECRDQIRGPALRKVRARDRDAAIARLTKRYGTDSLAVEIVEADAPRRGRPANQALDSYIAVICQVYRSITGRIPPVSWNRYSAQGAVLSPFGRLLCACFAAEFIRRGSISDHTLASAVRRVRRA
jgi:hypothetical protein